LVFRRPQNLERYSDAGRVQAERSLVARAAEARIQKGSHAIPAEAANARMEPSARSTSLRRFLFMIEITRCAQSATNEKPIAGSRFFQIRECVRNFISLRLQKSLLPDARSLHIVKYR